MKKRRYYDFRRKIFSITVSKKLVAERFFVSEKFGYGEKLWREVGAGITISGRKSFVSQYQKNSQGTLLCFEKNLVS